MNKKDLILWLSLIVLTLASYFFAEAGMPPSTLVGLLLVITAIKFLGIGFQFMELKKAHRFWKVSFVSIFLVFGILVLALA